MKLLQADARRELYEGAAANGRDGCGLFWITYTGDDPRYEPLTVSDVSLLQRRGLIERTWIDYDGNWKLTEKGRNA